jgi:RimJ/RimL family protein N-acetyltransferase
MPGSSPRPPVRRQRGRPAVGAQRYMSDQSEREYAVLADQLDALGEDIEQARECADRAQQAPTTMSHHAPVSPVPAPRGEPVSLADGARILIRPIEPSDAHLLESNFDHLSAVSRYRRFLSPLDHLSQDQLTYLTQIDHELHEALVALDAHTGEGVGVARSIRDPAEAGHAEVSVVVSDLWQARGVGGVLIERLAALARASGVEHFTARLLIGNQAGHRLLERVAEEIDEREYAGAIELTARLRT